LRDKEEPRGDNSFDAFQGLEDAAEMCRWIFEHTKIVQFAALLSERRLDILVYIFL
jgi:hypothetical protein